LCDQKVFGTALLAVDAQDLGGLFPQSWVVWLDPVLPSAAGRDAPFAMPVPHADRVQNARMPSTAAVTAATICAAVMCTVVSVDQMPSCVAASPAALGLPRGQIADLGRQASRASQVLPGVGGGDRVDSAHGRGEQVVELGQPQRLLGPGQCPRLGNVERQYETKRAGSAAAGLPLLYRAGHPAGLGTGAEPGPHRS
jgi:hypothetical protein